MIVATGISFGIRPPGPDTVGAFNMSITGEIPQGLVLCMQETHTHVHTHMRIHIHIHIQLLSLNLGVKYEFKLEVSTDLTSIIYPRRDLPIIVDCTE